MNFFYEAFPDSVCVRGEEISIITDFREYIRLLDMLKCEELNDTQKTELLSEYFLDEILIDEEAIAALTEFVLMDTEEKKTEEDPSEDQKDQEEQDGSQKNLFSYEIDYPFILSGFLRDYGIDLETVDYLHWWKFCAMFSDLSPDTTFENMRVFRDKHNRGLLTKEERQIWAENVELLDLNYEPPDAETREAIEKFENGNAIGLY